MKHTDRDPLLKQGAGAFSALELWPLEEVCVGDVSSPPSSGSVSASSEWHLGLGFAFLHY